MTEIQSNYTTGKLHGERVHLRRPTMNDVQYVYNWERDDEVWRYDGRRVVVDAPSGFATAPARMLSGRRTPMCWWSSRTARS